MNCNNVEIIEMMMRRTQDLRHSLSGEPSADTLAEWSLDDAHKEMLLDYYARQEDEDGFTFNFTSEVKKP